VDAKRIAQFTCLHRHRLKALRLPSDCLLKLKKPGGVPLMSFRDRLVKTSTSLKNTIQDLRETSHMVDNKLIVSLSQKQQKLIEQQIAHVEKEMEATLQQDEQIFQHFQLAKSVVGIGLVTAVAFLIYTQDFTAFDNGRQFACYAGVAPFEHSSGTSVRGRTRVSPLANRKMKALLGNCASAAVQYDPQLKAYYHRKREEPGARRR